MFLAFLYRDHRRTRHRRQHFVPSDRLANSMLGLLDAWEADMYYKRFEELASLTTDSTVIFLATKKLLSPMTSRYTTSVRLGGGAFGVVHKIDVADLGQSFALKVIKAVRLVLTPVYLFVGGGCDACAA